jgi:hypothetical protein
MSRRAQMSHRVLLRPHVLYEDIVHLVVAACQLALVTLPSSTHSHPPPPGHPSTCPRFTHLAFGYRTREADRRTDRKTDRQAEKKPALTRSSQSGRCESRCGLPDLPLQQLGAGSGTLRVNSPHCRHCRGAIHAVKPLRTRGFSWLKHPNAG